jgi:hypothetical protein
MKIKIISIVGVIMLSLAFVNAQEITIFQDKEKEDLTEKLGVLPIETIPVVWEYVKTIMTDIIKCMPTLINSFIQVNPIAFLFCFICTCFGVNIICWIPCYLIGLSSSYACCYTTETTQQKKPQYVYVYEDEV